MKYGPAVWSFICLTFIYLFALIWMDSKSHLFNEVSKLATILPILFLISLASYGVRYARWHWLLKRAGSKIGLTKGFLAYLSGFAFTATPGKVGELIRIRYLAPMGIAPSLVLGAFIFERAFDLISVLLLSAVAISDPNIFLFVLGFVTILLLTLYFFARRPAFLLSASKWLLQKKCIRASRLISMLGEGLTFTLQWMNFINIGASLILGLVAWGLTSAAFLILLHYLGIALPFFTSFAIYPLAMLAGAASMIPGGLGSTEASITALLMLHGVSIGLAAVAAIGIRLATIWFAILIGFISLMLLEIRKDDNLSKT